MENVENPVGSELESGTDSAIMEEDHLPNTDEDIHLELQASISKVKFAVDIAQERRNKGNNKFLEKFVGYNTSNTLLAEELTKVRAQRAMPRTWAPHKHPATSHIL